jgi:isovaleryl-CoA dehydrogenase
MRGSPTGDLTFENMKIHESNVLKGEGRGAAVLMSGLNIERILAAAIPVGIAQG